MGHTAPDWVGYRALYDERGAWLRAFGRDPAFVWVVSQARAMLGADGYPRFRALYFGVLIILTGSCVFRIPEPGTPSLRDRAFVVFVCTSIFLLEVLEFIREGLTFLLVLVAALLLVEKRSIPRLVMSAALAVAALTIHLGSLFMVLTVAVGFAVSSLAPGSLSRLRGPLLGLGLLAGGALSGLAFAFPGLLGNALHGFAYNGLLNHHVHYRGILYWLVFGALLIAMIATVKPADPTNSAAMSTIESLTGCAALPALYVMSLCLLFVDGYLGTLRGIILRLFFEFLALNLFARLYSGRRDFATFAGSAFFLMTETITLVTTRSTGS